MKKVLFVTGIDTGIGKTIATGLLAKKYEAEGVKVITQKMVQTGCKEISEDIETHRKIQGWQLLDIDKSGLTCPFLYSYPCSPHMAAKKDGGKIDTDKVKKATDKLLESFDLVLLEGAGGLMVPLDNEKLAIDYIAEQKIPIILVTNGKLGSINHTLLSLTACRHYGIEVEQVVYNLYPIEDELINANTLEYLKSYLAGNWPNTTLITIDRIKF